MQKQVSDLTFPNLALFREECRRRLKKEPLKLFDQASIEIIQSILVAYVREHSCNHEPRWATQEHWTQDPCLMVIEQDIIYSPLPKWAAMASWINLDGIVKYHPRLVLAIIRGALDNFENR